MRSKKQVNINVIVRNILILIIFIAVLVLCICLPNSGDFSPNVNKTRYRSEKNAEELKKVYEEAGNKEKFLNDVSLIQNAVSMTLLNNNVVDEASLKSKVSEINKELRKSKWDLLQIDVPTFWVGTWSVDDEGTVKFAFLNDLSIPSWAKDEDVSPYIILK